MLNWLEGKDVNSKLITPLAVSSTKASKHSWGIQLPNLPFPRRHSPFRFVFLVVFFHIFPYQPSLTSVSGVKIQPKVFIWAEIPKTAVPVILRTTLQHSLNKLHRRTQTNGSTWVLHGKIGISLATMALNVMNVWGIPWANNYDKILNIEGC